MTISRRDFLPAILTGAAADPTVARTDADRLAILRKCYGDDRVLDALQESGGRILEAKRILCRERQRHKRAATREERRNKRTDQHLYRGPVTLSPEVVDFISAGREVKSVMSGRRLTRATCRELAIGALEVGGQGVVITVDHRNGALDGGPLMAEVLYTGAGHRVHLYRSKAMGSQKPVVEMRFPPPPLPAIEPATEPPTPAWIAELMEEPCQS